MVTLVALGALLTWHPLHSSSAQVRLPVSGGPGDVTVRVFADDFPPGQDSASAAQYLSARFRITDQSGRWAPLALQSLRRDGVLLILSLRMTLPAGFRAVSIWHGVLAERFPDQVNLVQVIRGTRNATLLFSRGDGAKPLP